MPAARGSSRGGASSSTLLRLATGLLFCLVLGLLFRVRQLTDRLSFADASVASKASSLARCRDDRISLQTHVDDLSRELKEKQQQLEQHEQERRRRHERDQEEAKEEEEDAEEKEQQQQGGRREGSPLAVGGGFGLSVADSPAPEGVAVVCCLDGPGWLQKRYSLSVANVMLGLPPTYKVQLFHRPSAQSLKGLRDNPFLGQLVAAGRVVLTELQGPWAKRSRSEVYLSTMFWDSVAADNVFMFGHGGVRCLNSPLGLRNFTDRYDLTASSDGGFVSVRRADVLAFLHAALPSGADFLPKIHGPIPYLLSHLRKLPGLRVAPREVLSRFNMDDRSAKDEIPFTISGTMPNFAPEDRRFAIEACPEIKMIFPALDHPGCFGAGSTLDKDACIDSLCVSNPKKGGC